MNNLSFCQTYLCAPILKKGSKEIVYELNYLKVSAFAVGLLALGVAALGIASLSGDNGASSLLDHEVINGSIATGIGCVSVVFVALFLSQSANSPCLSLGPKEDFAAVATKQVPLDSHPKFPGQELTVLIPQFKDLTLTEENLARIFQLANHFTLNVNYPCLNERGRNGWGDALLNYGLPIYRPNHNGTHSARQVRYLEALFDFIEKCGSEKSKEELVRLTADEKINLKLAAYFLRAGRVDESSHKSKMPDDYYRRSAIIYREYAKSLGVAEETIQWVEKLINNSCKPKGVRDPSIDSVAKNMLGWKMLTLVHEIDLLRCYERASQEIKNGLNEFVSGSVNDNVFNKWLKFAGMIRKKTGVQRANTPKGRYSQLFAQCSVNGLLCWQQVRSVSIPEWE